MPEANATTVPAGTPAVSEDQAKAAKVKQNMIEQMTARGITPIVAPPAGERNLQLSPARMQGREYENNEWNITVESSWTMDDVVKPIFWSSVWQKLRRYDEITVRVDDGSWWARILVTQVGTGYAFVRALSFIDLTAAVATAPAALEGFELRELGPFKKWCVIRTADSFVLKEKCESRVDAQTWLDHYKVQQARTAAVQ